MKIVIAGGGRVGSALAERLVAEKHSVAVVERDKSTCDRLFEEIGVVTVNGDATDPKMLDSAGIGTADIAAGVLARDSDNLAFATLARISSSARVMVRMLDTSYREAYRIAGVRDIIAEAELVVAKIATAIDYPKIQGSLPLAAGNAILFEIVITAHATLAGKTVAQTRSAPGFPKECVFIGLVDQQGAIELPSGNSVLRPGHVAILVARKEQLDAAIECLTSEPEAAESVAQVIGALRRIDFLSPMNGEELAELARGLDLQRKSQGESIFRKGDAGDAFFLVLQGEVSLLDNAGVAIETIGAGDFFGEISLLTGEPRSATAIAKVESELAVIDRGDFHRVVMANPTVALQMSRLLGKRLANAAKTQRIDIRTLIPR